jgi:hypothetical protein
MAMMSPTFSPNNSSAIMNMRRGRKPMVKFLRRVFLSIMTFNNWAGCEYSVKIAYNKKGAKDRPFMPFDSLLDALFSEYPVFRP